MQAPRDEAIEKATTINTRFIQIIRASYGLNCMLRRESNLSLPKNYKSDNALMAVSSLCNGKDICKFNVSDKTLGLDPAPGCSQKELNVEYRCFSYDRLWQTTAVEGKALQIDCSA